MSLPDISVRRPITTLMLFIAILIIGLVSFQRLPIDLFPEIEPPVISVLIQYPGASAQDVELNVTKKVETGLGSVSELKTIRSTSIDGISVVTLEFEYGTNLDEASNDIRDALEFVKRQLPEDTEAPFIFKFSTNFFPIVFLGVTADESYEGLNKLIQDEIVDPLKRVPGVGTVQAFGGPIRQINVNVDPNKLEAYNITTTQIAEILGAENLNLPSGNIKMGKIDYNLRVPGEFTDVSEIGKVVVSQNNGRIVYLEDVASVSDSLKERTIQTRLNGKRGLQVIVQKQSGANTVQVAEAVFAKLDELKKNLPSDVEVNTIVDGSEFIVFSIANLSEAVILGGVFVSLVLLIFLRKWRAVFIVLLTLPFSLIGAFIYLYFTGNTINIISLSSLSIAIGMVVDDAIVILENITSHIERGSRPREAAIFGSTEVGLAVTAATFTIVAVFFPLVFITGLSGILFNQLGFLVTVTILVSLLAALTLIPMLASKMLKSTKEEKPIKNKLLKSIDGRLAKVFDAIDSFYQKVLTWALGNKVKIVVGAVLIFVASIALFTQIGTEFIPRSDSASISLSVELEPGIKLEETNKYVQKIESIVNAEFPEVRFTSTRAGVNDEGFSSILFGQSEGSNIFTAQMRLLRKTQRERSIFEISDSLRNRLEPIPGIKSFVINTSGMGAILTGGSTSPIEVNIIGNNLVATENVAQELKTFMTQLPGTRDVKIGRGEFRPELQVILDREKMALNGLNTAMVANTLRNNVYGLIATKYREEGDEYDIFIRFPSNYRTSQKLIEDIPVKTITGNIVKVKDVGDVVERYSPPDIQREDQERVVRVTAFNEGRALGDIAADIQNYVAQMDMPQGIVIEYGGQIEQQSEAFTDLLLLLVLSIILVYMVMAAQFESLLDPFVIMFSIPFAFTGVALGLFVFGETFNVISFLGAILLVGIVVKNAIVLVDYINITRARGYELKEAIIYSGRNRLRPVLMTTLTTLLGTLPLVISTGEGSEVWRPLGVATVGGLTVSTIITLLLVPVIYSIFETRVKNKKQVD
ncbi:MAG: efflux RND transporter permease subunit [Melioribacteraceae bacterium]|jgi:HAE1 family hydrophobic/amphiphilic exporter-1|nr:efflux RND transporter permease subunit [Melioribacteraceae bacterium]